MRRNEDINSPALRVVALLARGAGQGAIGVPAVTAGYASGPRAFTVALVAVIGCQLLVLRSANFLPVRIHQSSPDGSKWKGQTDDGKEVRIDRDKLTEKETKR